MEADDMRAVATRWADGSVLERVPVNPFRTTFHWSLGPGAARLELRSDPDARPAVIPEHPTLLTGGAGSGRRATLDRLAEHATRAGWFVVRAGAGTDGLDGVASAVSTVAHRGAPAGVLVCVDDLHAASRAECEQLFATIAPNDRMPGHPPLRFVASATHRSSLAIDQPALGPLHGSLHDVELVLDAGGLANAFGAVASAHGRELRIDAALALHAASAGVAGLALEHATAAWDATRGDILTAERINAVRAHVEAARQARMRATHASRFSLGQRRYLRAVASHGTNHARVEDVTRSLRELTRFEITDSMLASVSNELVRQGVLMVRDGVATITTPGLAFAV